MTVPELTCQQLVEVITEYLEGGMPVDQRLLFEQHLASCSSCVTYLEQMRATIRTTGTLREEDLRPEERDQMLRVFQDWNG